MKKQICIVYEPCDEIKQGKSVIFLAGGEIFVGHCILNLHSAACGNFLFAVHRRFCADFGDFYLYRLIFVLDIRVYGKLFAILIQRFKNHKACAARVRKGRHILLR